MVKVIEAGLCPVYEVPWEPFPRCVMGVDDYCNDICVQANYVEGRYDGDRCKCYDVCAM